MIGRKRSGFTVAVCALAVVLGSAERTTAGEVDSLRQELLSAIRGGADYTVRVLLDPQGKSRCDYNLLTGKWEDYEPAWHTGQIILALTRAFEVTGDSLYLNAARRAGDWWVSLQIKDHPVLKGMVRAIHGAGIPYIVFATVTDGTAGLFRLYRLTGEERYARVPTEAGEWMLEHMRDPKTRMFYDAVDPNTGEVMKHWSPFWPEKKRFTIDDVARPNNEGSLFKDMYEYTGDERYKGVFLETCEVLLERQGPEGLWMDFTPNNKEEGYFHPRFNLWYAESLLEGYELTRDERYLRAALKTARFYTRFQQPNGAFYYRNYLDGRADRYSISGSTTAFAGIVWLRLLRYGVGEEFRDNIQRSLRWLLGHRYPTDHPDPNQAGGFLEIRAKAKKGKLRILQRDIATSFAVRFLCDYYEYTVGGSANK